MYLSACVLSLTFQVENVVMLSEYEQNLSKEKEWEPPAPPTMVPESETPSRLNGIRLFRKWPSLFRTNSNNMKSDSFGELVNDSLLGMLPTIFFHFHTFLKYMYELPWTLDKNYPRHVVRS